MQDFMANTLGVIELPESENSWESCLLPRVPQTTAKESPADLNVLADLETLTTELEATYRQLQAA